LTEWWNKQKAKQKGMSSIRGPSRFRSEIAAWNDWEELAYEEHTCHHVGHRTLELMVRKISP
jgi:hypothetical protein